MSNMEKNNEELVGAEEKQEIGRAEPDAAKPKRDYVLPASILISVLVLSGTWIYTANLEGGKAGIGARQNATQAADALAEAVAPSGGVTLPARWGDLGEQLVKAGVIDETQFKAIYAQRGGLTADEQALLDAPNNGNLTITPQNAGVVLNLLWAFGLGNKNPILENGPMQDPQYGGAGRFASTGGWTIAAGNAMSHYSQHQFATLTADQQAVVEKISKNIYRLCCGNSTYFPDCNHGMAMLGLLELMASQGATEDQMYQAALAANSYWFPDQYRTLAQYFESKGVPWSSVDPRAVLGQQYSSAQGYAQIQSLTPQTAPAQSTGGCGIGGGQPIQQAPQQRQSGCGV